MFALAVPRHFTQQHLHVLADVAQRFSDDAFRATLRDAGDIATLRALLLAPTRAAAPAPAETTG